MGTTKDEKEKKKRKGNVISEAFINRYRKSKKFRRFLKILLVLIIVAVVLIVICAVFRIPQKIKERFKKDKNISYSVSEAVIHYSPKGEWLIGASKGTAVICDESGITAFDENGEWKWNRTLSVEQAAVNSGEGATLIIDRKSGIVYAFGDTGLMWRYNSDNPVKAAFLNREGTGFITVTDEAGYASVVKYFTVKENLPSEVFTARLSKYYVLDAAFCENEGQLALSCVYRSGEDLMSAIVFLKAKNGEIFDTIVTQDRIYTDSAYISGGMLFTAETGSLKRCSRMLTASKNNDCEETLWERMGTRQQISGACSITDRYYAVAYTKDNIDKEDKTGSVIVYYDREGKEAHRIEAEGTVTDMKSCGGMLAAAAGNVLYVYNVNGFLSAKYETEDSIETVIPMDELHFTVITPSEIRVISLKEEK